MPTAAMLLTVLLGAEAARPIDFDTQIVPVLTTAGCNVGSCHGSAAGRGGFKLSLYGSDPAVDYQAIAQAMEGRRINLSRPERSLLLLKPTGEVDHGGDTPLEDHPQGAALLLNWIQAGANRLEKRRLVQFDVTPSRHVAKSIGTKLSLRAIARFSDGSTDDVTRWTVFHPEDSAAVTIDRVTSEATLLRRGRHLVTARFLDRVVPIELIVPLGTKPVELVGQPRVNFIDEAIYETLETLRLPVSPLSDDATFLRRVRLDLTGTLPPVAEVKAFLADRRDDKRPRLIDRLISSEEFTDYWTHQFATLLRIRSQAKDTTGARTYHRWLRKQIAAAVPYDAIARQLLTASGDSHEQGPPNFYRTVRDARSQAELVSELLMGVRLRCANCHNHPLDRWTQDDYHGLAAVFAKIERGRVIKVGTRGEVTHPRTGEAAVPRIPGVRFIADEADGRAALADWMTDADNPFFARAVVNRLWKALMGRGLVEPTDDLRATNPATHPQLLDRLARDFVAHDYDLRHTIRLICTSATFARSARATAANRADDRFYSHALVRRLSAEVLADALAEVTGVSDRYGDEPQGTRAVTLFAANVPSEALDILGRCSREDSCESAATNMGATLSRTLHLMNGAVINRKITSADGRLHKQIAAGRSGQQIVAEFYVRSLGRPPSDVEKRYWKQQLTSARDNQQYVQMLEDFVWSLLTCREFVTNH